MRTRHLEADRLYGECAAEFGAAIERLASAYEADADRRRDLVQDIHSALWQSLHTFDGRCSLRTWTYRVAHNIGATHVSRELRSRWRQWTSLEDAAAVACDRDHEASTNRRIALERLYSFIHELHPLDRQVILLYLEGMDAASIAEVCGVSPGNAATKVHRIKAVLARRFQQRHREGDRDATGRDAGAVAEPADGVDGVDVEPGSKNRVFV